MSLERKRRGRPPGSKNKKVKLRNNIKIEKDTFTCTVCSKSISTHEYDSHRKECEHNFMQSNFGVKSKPKYYCKKCSKKFKIKDSYKSHLLNEHSETPGSLPCQQCHVVCPNEEILKTHIENVHERDVFECDYCEKKFARRAHVVRHMIQRGCDGKSKMIYPCEICNKTFNRKDNLMVHLRMNHITRKEYCCKSCGYSTNNFTKLIRHSQQNHSAPNRFECDHCGKITSSRAAISKHLEIHGDKKYECDVCGHNTYTIEVMRRHVFTHIPNKPHKCETCGSTFIQKLQLQRHMIKHIGYKCTKCDLSFNSKTKLILHYKKHLDKLNILCPFEGCPRSTKALADQDAYSDHIKIHLIEKVFMCNVCGKRFHNEAFLKRHISTHALERPRRCMYCVSPRAYVRGEQLVRHVRKTHPDVFKAKLQHVRNVLGSTLSGQRVKKSEIECILNVLDAESDRILQDYGQGVLYGGLQEEETLEIEEEPVSEQQSTDEDSPLMTEDELENNLKKLLSQLIGSDVLECFGWPDEDVDIILEKVIEQMGARPASRDKWSRVQRLRENTKHLFLYAVEDKTIAKMLDTHTIDQVVKHILVQVTPDNIKTEDNES